jgi:hypothetical protein
MKLNQKLVTQWRRKTIILGFAILPRESKDKNTAALLVPLTKDERVIF